MALLHARGQLQVGDPYIGRSIIGTELDCSLVSTFALGDRADDFGRAWVTGTMQHMLDPDDPFQGGYRLSDTWQHLT